MACRYGRATAQLIFFSAVITIHSPLSPAPTRAIAKALSLSSASSFASQWTEDAKSFTAVLRMCAELLENARQGAASAV